MWRHKPGGNSLLAGFLGGGNVGDEALVDAFCYSLADGASGHHSITIISGSPEVTRTMIKTESVTLLKGLYPGPTMTIKELAATIYHFAKTDRLVFIGGGIIQDVHGLNLLTHSVFYGQLARLFNRPAVAIGVGAGPIRTKEGRLLAKVWADSLSLAYARDSDSFDLLRRLSEDKEIIRHGTDSSFLLPASHRGPKTNTIGLCLRKWKSLQDGAVLELIDTLSQKNYNLTYLCFEPDDVDYLRNLGIDEKEIVRPTSVEAAIRHIENLDGIVSMRLHGNLFAMQAGTPFCALAYDPKVSNVLSELGFGARVFKMDFDPSEVVETLLSVDVNADQGVDWARQTARKMAQESLTIAEPRKCSLAGKVEALSKVLAIALQKIIFRKVLYYKSRLIVRLYNP